MRQSGRQFLIRSPLTEKLFQEYLYSEGLTWDRQTVPPLPTISVPPRVEAASWPAKVDRLRAPSQGESSIATDKSVGHELPSRDARSAGR